MNTGPKNSHDLLDWMILLAAAAIILLALLYAQPSKAQGKPRERAESKVECEIEGQPGVCLPREDARWVARRVEHLRAYPDLYAAYQDKTERINEAPSPLELSGFSAAGAFLCWGALELSVDRPPTWSRVLAPATCASASAGLYYKIRF